MIHTIYTTCSRSKDTWEYLTLTIIWIAFRQQLKRTTIHSHRTLAIERNENHTRRTKVTTKTATVNLCYNDALILHSARLSWCGKT